MAPENQHGGKRDGAGRPRGSLNKRSLAAIEAVAERWPDWSPLEHFAKVANDETLDVEIRLDAAKAASPFMHAKLKPIVADADEVVELEGRIVAARVAATAKAIDANPGLADRLERAMLLRPNEPTYVVAMPSAPPSRAQHIVIDATPAEPTAPPAGDDPAPATNADRVPMGSSAIIAAEPPQMQPYASFLPLKQAFADDMDPDSFGFLSDYRD